MDSLDLNKDCRTMFKTLGWEEGNQGVVGDYFRESIWSINVWCIWCMGTGHDYIAIASQNLRFTKWKKTFVIFPKTTVSGNRIWLKTCWKRRRWMHVEKNPP